MSYFSKSNNVKELTCKDFDDSQVNKLRNQESCAILFYAPWCIHCKNVAPIWEKLAARLPYFNLYAFDCVANAGHHDKIKNDYPDMINGYPTIWFYENGLPVSKYEGQRSEELLMKEIMNH